MGRSPCCDKDNVKRGPWSPEEDAILKSYVETHGTVGNWIALPRKAGLRRCGKSCRLRWLNYLRPDIKHGGFTEEEDNIICTLYAQIGSRWSVIASNLSGRTDNDVKNHWNTKLKKKILAGEINLKALKENDTFLPSTTPSLIQDVMPQNLDYPASQIQNPPLPSVLQIDNNNGYASSGFNMIHEQNMGSDLMDVVSNIGSSSGNYNPMVSFLSQEGPSNISDSSTNKCLSLPPEHDGDVGMMDFGFEFPYDPTNYHGRVGEFTPSNYYYSEWADLSNDDIKPH